jgi:hypothetical protein
MGTHISLNERTTRTTMPITPMQLTPGLAVVQIPLSLSQNLGRLSQKYAAQDGAAGNIPADTFPVAGQDQTVAYGWDGREVDLSLIDVGITPNNSPRLYFGRGLQASFNAGSPAWKDSASWGCSAVRGAGLQPATWIA